MTLNISDFVALERERHAQARTDAEILFMSTRMLHQDRRFVGPKVMALGEVLSAGGLPVSEATACLLHISTSAHQHIVRHYLHQCYEHE